MSGSVRSMRVALDLQPCQTESRWRGIGRYSSDLAAALLRRGCRHEFVLGLDGTYPSPASDLRERFGCHAQAPSFLTYYYPLPHLPVSVQTDARRSAAESLIRHKYAQFSPEVVHVNSLFEGFFEHAAGLGRLAGLPGTVSSVTLYDLIPLVLPDWYLVDPVYRDWYRHRLEQVSCFDVVFCISEATRRDAIEHLGLPEDRLFVIDAGVDGRLLDAARNAPLDAGFRRRFGIEGRYVLYTGNADPRKNLAGAVQAFAEVPAELRRGIQLVLNQVGDAQAIRKIARTAGLEDRDLVVTGHVHDDELEALLRNCHLFYFPSLYEGFGLPVLEAMACGAPTICADNSSLPEVMGRADATFDARSTQSIATKLSQALADDGFRESLRRHGRERAARFTWDNSADKALQAWGGAVERKARAQIHVASEQRLRIAIVTPLPPDRTGIADYMAELVKALGERMEIELFVGADETVEHSRGLPHRVSHWRELERRLQRFDQIVYQMGNSPFHSHMFDLMQRHPGVVVLHDIYLSAMLNNMDLYEGYPGILAEEIEFSHGRGPLLEMEAPGRRSSIVQSLPCSRRVLECADAIIVHSGHSLDTITSHYPGVTRSPIFQAPMPHTGCPPSAERRAIAREVLGLGPDEVLLVSLGFVADTKGSLELLEALQDPELEVSGLRVAFVGGVDIGGYEELFEAALSSHSLRDRITVTGFASPEQYSLYLDAADVAVQLRVHSRGETSKSLLDCLSRGIATVANAYGSLVEVPSDCASFISADFSASELSQAVRELVSCRETRKRFSRAAHHFVRKHHSPEVTAQVYETAVRASLVSRMTRGEDELTCGLVHSVTSPDADDSCLSAIEDALRVCTSKVSTRLYVDVTDVVQCDHSTGIQRVVRNVARELVRSETTDSRTVLVALNASGQLAGLRDGIEPIVDLPVRLGVDEFLPSPGDVLFLLDSTWEMPERFQHAIDAVRTKGGKVHAMVYDLIPQRFPDYFVDFMPPVHAHWLRFVVGACDGIVCISKAVADDLISWIFEHEVAHRPGLRIDFVPLGSDVAEGRHRGIDLPPDPDLVGAFGGGSPMELMVGTLEPRKRHALVLSAFERLWADGHDTALMIVGKKGWNVDELAERIRSHPEHGSRLFWFDNASDSDLVFAYANAKRVIQASAAEGFGLPLIEAAAHECPVLASDIPVFREVAGDSADYFVSGDVDSLVDALARPPAGRPDVRATTWAECARALRRLFGSAKWRYTLPGGDAQQ